VKRIDIFNFDCTIKVHFEHSLGLLQLQLLHLRNAPKIDSRKKYTHVQMAALLSKKKTKKKNTPALPTPAVTSTACVARVLLNELLSA
jgi:hypothetical protein